MTLKNTSLIEKHIAFFAEHADALTHAHTLTQ